MTYKSGDYWVIDDISGFKIRSSDAVKQWDGLLVHRDHADIRNPQDFVRGRKDRQTVPDARPELADVFIGPGEQLMTELGEFLFTENGAYIEVEV